MFGGRDAFAGRVGPGARGARAARVLLVGMVVGGGAVAVGATGQGLAPTRLVLADGGIWLPTSTTGALVHLSGPTGRADAAVTVPGAAGRDLTVTTTDSLIIATAPDDGQLYLVDPARLTGARTADLGPGTTITGGSGALYALDVQAGRVRTLSPRDLTAVAAPLDLPAPLGGAAQTGDGTLWVSLRATGAVAAVRDGVAATHPITPPGNAVDIVLSDGRPVAVDSTAGTVTLLGAGSASGLDARRAEQAPPAEEVRPGEERGTGAPRPAGKAITLPRAGQPPGPPGTAALLAAPRTDGGPVPIVDPEAHQLFLVDVDTGAVTVVELPEGDRPGVPLVQAGHAYVPRSALGVVADYDITRGAFGTPVTVASPDGQARLTVAGDGEQVWINDADGPNAVLINERGAVTISKQPPPDLPGVPTSSARPLPAAPPLPAPARPRPDRRGEVTRPATPGPTTSRPPAEPTSGTGTVTGTGTGTGGEVQPRPERTTPGPTTSRTAPPPPPRPPTPPPVTTSPVRTPPVATPTVPVPTSATPDPILG